MAGSQTERESISTISHIGSLSNTFAGSGCTIFEPELSHMDDWASIEDQTKSSTVNFSSYRKKNAKSRVPDTIEELNEDDK